MNGAVVTVSRRPRRGARAEAIKNLGLSSLTGGYADRAKTLNLNSRSGGEIPAAPLCMKVWGLRREAAFVNIPFTCLMQKGSENCARLGCRCMKQALEEAGK